MTPDDFHIFLVEPGESLNVGSVARAMSNLGFRHLHLVAPRDYDAERAARTACAGHPVLAQLKIHASLEVGLASMQEVVGFSGQHGKHRPQHVFLHEWEAQLRGRDSVRTALVFGPEDTGLRTEHLAHCRWTVRIPSSEENFSFNLAQAVLVVLLELSRPGWQSLSTLSEVAPMELFYQLDRVVNEVLERCEFYRPGTPEPIPDLVKNMLRRISPDAREMSVLLALFARINGTLRRLGRGLAQDPSAGDLSPEKDRK